MTLLQSLTVASADVAAGHEDAGDTVSEPTRNRWPGHLCRRASPYGMLAR